MVFVVVRIFPPQWNRREGFGRVERGCVDPTIWGLPPEPSVPPCQEGQNKCNAPITWLPIADILTKSNQTNYVGKLRLRIQTFQHHWLCSHVEHQQSKLVTPIRRSSFSWRKVASSILMTVWTFLSISNSKYFAKVLKEELLTSLTVPRVNDLATYTRVTHAWTSWTSCL